jgi:uncharacterized protein YbjT (DUF2867 family)
MIVITGVTGQLGSAVAEGVLRRLPASQIALSVRKPEQAGPFKDRGMDVRRGDFDEPESLFRSFAGAERLLLISASGIDHEKRSARHRNAVDAAVRAGVGHIYYTSLLPGHDSLAFVMKAHLDTEADIKASGLPFTILKNGVYAEAWESYLGKSGEVVVPADGPISWVSRLDLAEGIAKLLLDGGHLGETLNLTGPDAVDIKSVAGLQGRPMRIVSTEEYVAKLRAAGKDEDFARKWATTYFAMERGEFARIDSFLRTLLGRPLKTVEQVVMCRMPR